ncbi:MAG: HDIG domain-containing protein [Opitutales bacterium]|nr:HDIG domain-containing protein [Opitutales bacterium]
MGSNSKKKRREEGALIYRVFQEPQVPLGERLRRLFAGTWVLLLFGTLLSFVAFFGRPPRAPVVYEGQVPNYSFAAPFSFSYTSKIRRSEQEENARLHVGPVYTLKLEAQERLLEFFVRVSEKNIAEFPRLKQLKVRTTRDAAIVENLRSVFESMKLETLNPRLNRPEALQELAMGQSRLIEYCNNAKDYEKLVLASRDVFLNLAKEGIFEDGFGRGKTAAFDESRGTERAGYTESEFKRAFSERLQNVLWQRVFADRTRSNLTKIVDEVEYIFQVSSLFRTNMFFDREATIRQKDLAAESVGDTVVHVHAGEYLLNERVPVSAEMLERWKAYRAEEDKSRSRVFGDVRSFFSDTFYTCCILLSAAIFCIIFVPNVFRERRNVIALAGTLILLDTALVRLLAGIVESPRFEQIFAQTENIQIWLSAPTIVAILAAVMLGTPLAVITSMTAAAVIALMLGGSVECLLVSAVAVVTSVYIARDARKRAVLLRAGLYAGIATALTSLLVGFHDGTSWQSVAYNFMTALVVGGISGVIASGVLSVFEGIFKTTTNITLLELADYDHPLLRRLQVVAPGTFLHSVMVADFAAKAAQAAGANAVLCRCAALYHDVGKTLKPEFFTENQKAGMENPHEQLTPAMSALIIKSHVREGVELAEEYHLPRPVCDVIRQHHGKSLVGYFIRKAQQLAILSGDEALVDESNYRYDGPRPQTMEAAILMLCDIVEASSRSLKKVTQQAVEDLVEKLVYERVKDGELSDCPITLRQIDVIRKSLVNSVLMSYHKRISYADADKEKPPVPANADEAGKVPQIRILGKDAFPKEDAPKAEDNPVNAKS